jgi:hypothetical protein
MFNGTMAQLQSCAGAIARSPYRKSSLPFDHDFEVLAWQHQRSVA